MSKEDRHHFIYSNLESKNGSDLGNFIYHIKHSKVNLKEYNEIFLNKLKDSKYPYDINILLETLIENKENKSEIELALNSKIKIWDTANWSEKFWALIHTNDLNVKKPTYYDIENVSSKKYNISEFMKSKIENNELGTNPLLMIDWKIVNYEDGKLIETLEKIDIKQIDYTSKNHAAGLYGNRGTDGLLSIISN